MPVSTISDGMFMRVRETSEKETTHVSRLGVNEKWKKCEYEFVGLFWRLLIIYNVNRLKFKVLFLTFTRKWQRTIEKDHLTERGERLWDTIKMKTLRGMKGLSITRVKYEVILLSYSVLVA